MADHNQNGGRSGFAEDRRSSWRPQAPESQGTRGRQAEDERGDVRAWRDPSSPREEHHAGEREPWCWDAGRGRGELDAEDRELSRRSTERPGQGGYGAGSHGDDRPQPLAIRGDRPSPGSFEDRCRDDRYRDLGTGDRATGRGQPSYRERTGYDLDRYAGQVGHDFAAERRGLSRASDDDGEHTGYPAGSYSRSATGYGGEAAHAIPPRNAEPEPHVHRGTGPHRGKGPSSYQRSDERIRELVCESLADDDQIDATNIEVAVAHGEVTLSGTIADRRAKRDAEDCAWSVWGVRDVQNRLRVVRDDRSIRSHPASDPPGQTPVGSHETESPVPDRHRA